MSNITVNSHVSLAICSSSLEQHTFTSFASKTLTLLTSPLSQTGLLCKSNYVIISSNEYANIASSLIMRQDCFKENRWKKRMFLLCRF